MTCGRKGLRVVDSSEFVNVKVGGVRRGWSEFDASYAACSPRALSIWIIRVPGFSSALYSIKSTISAVHSRFRVHEISGD